MHTNMGPLHRTALELPEQAGGGMASLSLGLPGSHEWASCMYTGMDFSSSVLMSWLLQRYPELSTLLALLP